MGEVDRRPRTVGVGSVFLGWELRSTQAPQLVTPATAEFKAAVPVRSPTDEVRTLLAASRMAPANLMLVERLLERRPDIRLLVAKDGVRWASDGACRTIDVILMDINLPGISGLVALGILAKDPEELRAFLWSLSSANAMPRDVKHGLAAGFFLYLTKPIKVNEFMDTLDKALAFAKRRAAAAEALGEVR